jgi:PPOX class probable F420-dependent enzyme
MILQAWRAMRQMNREEWRAFLSHGTRTGKLGTTRRDGRPHVVPIWFVLDGDDLVFNTGADSVKGRSLRRDPRVCLCVDDERPPFAFVMVEGTASLSEDLDELRRTATLIGARYMGQERAEEFGRRNAVPGELVVRVTPTRVLAQADITG